MTLSIAIILFVVALLVNLVWDHMTILKKNKVNHWWHGAVKVVSCVPAIYCFFRFLDNVDWFVAIPVSVLLMWSWFWLLFDGIINLVRGHHFFFAGSEDGADDAISDNILQSMPVLAGAAIKIAFCVATAFVYYKLSLN